MEPLIIELPVQRTTEPVHQPETAVRELTTTELALIGGGTANVSWL